MFVTGIADEAGHALDTQIRAHHELGWKEIELRTVAFEGAEGANLHDLPEEAFERVADRLDAAGLQVCCFSSKIANWGKKIDGGEDVSLEETARTIPRMQRLGTRFVRIMSYAVRHGEKDQMESERFRRVREICARFLDAGLQPVHENCMNYGGMGWPYTLRLLEEVPGLKLVFDTGNPFFADDYTRPAPRPKQDAWEFYEQVRDHVVYVHIKDGSWDADRQKKVFCWPGDGQGSVRRIVADLLARGYDGGFAIEPHLGAVYDLPGVTSDAEAQYAMYLEYGRRFEAILEAARSTPAG